MNLWTAQDHSERFFSGKTWALLATHSSEAARCFPLKVEIYRPRAEALKGWQSPERNGYRGNHRVA